jgi:hypothetical protein
MKDLDERSGEPALLANDCGEFRKYLRQNLRVTG